MHKSVDSLEIVYIFNHVVNWQMFLLLFFLLLLFLGEIAFQDIEKNCLVSQ